jgi:hypothetical protein
VRNPISRLDGNENSSLPTDREMPHGHSSFLL